MFHYKTIGSNLITNTLLIHAFCYHLLWRSLHQSGENSILYTMLSMHVIEIRRKNLCRISNRQGKSGRIGNENNACCIAVYIFTFVNIQNVMQKYFHKHIFIFVMVNKDLYGVLICVMHIYPWTGQRTRFGERGEIKSAPLRRQWTIMLKHIIEKG